MLKPLISASCKLIRLRQIRHFFFQLFKLSQLIRHRQLHELTEIHEVSEAITSQANCQTPDLKAKTVATLGNPSFKH
jgi:hypothetical protein